MASAFTTRASIFPVPRRCLGRPGSIGVFIVQALLLLSFALASLSCAGSRPKSSPESAATQPAKIVWPPAPDEPRILYIRSLRSPADIGQNPSLFKRVGQWFTGEQNQSVALQKPVGLALDEFGNLCITDTSAKRVTLCDFKRKQWRTYTSAGKIRFRSPVAAAFRNGMLYVADSELGKVFALSQDGSSSLEIFSPLLRPVGLALTADSLAVVDSQAHSVFVFDLSGKLRSSFGKRGVEPGQFNFPTHISVDRAGHFLVTDSMNCRIQVFDSKGNFISQFGSNGDTSGHFSRPKGVAADSFGHIYVADALFDNFQIFDLAGRFLLDVGATGSAAGQFGMPGGLAISNDNEIFVADSYNHRVQVFKYIGGP